MATCKKRTHLECGPTFCSHPDLPRCDKYVTEGNIDHVHHVPKEERKK